MRVLVDANILIDYVDGEPYARRFFSRLMTDGVPANFIPQAYAEAERATCASPKLAALSSELGHHDLFVVAKPSPDEEALSQGLKATAISTLGYDIGTVDRLLLAVAMSRKLVVATRDKDLIALGRSVGVRFI